MTKTMFVGIIDYYVYMANWSHNSNSSCVSSLGIDVSALIVYPANIIILLNTMTIINFPRCPTIRIKYIIQLVKVVLQYKMTK